MSVGPMTFMLANVNQNCHNAFEEEGCVLSTYYFFYKVIKAPHRHSRTHKSNHESCVHTKKYLVIARLSVTTTVSGRQVAASMDRSRSGLLRQPDKRGAAAGAAANKKAINRMDSMGYGVRLRPPLVLNLGSTDLPSCACLNTVHSPLTLHRVGVAN